MARYSIHSRHTGHTYGDYEGATPAEALAALIEEAGGSGDADPTLDDVVIVEEMHPRWDCQIEGDQCLTMRAESAEQAAREYVRGCDFDEETRETIGSNPITVIVWGDGDDVPQLVSVAMRDGRLAR